MSLYTIMVSRYTERFVNENNNITNVNLELDIFIRLGVLCPSSCFIFFLLFQSSVNHCTLIKNSKILNILLFFKATGLELSPQHGQIVFQNIKVLL